MSDSIAIAAVTSMLARLLSDGVGAGVNEEQEPVLITTLPPDKAKDASGITATSWLNLFLYHITPNVAWRNMSVPWQTANGEVGRPPLALNLYYLMTPYFGDSQDSVVRTDGDLIGGSHHLLGRGMGIFHDLGIVPVDEIKKSLPDREKNSHPFNALESVKISLQPLSLDEISKLWSSFQAEYRISVAYEVSVVLVESARSAPTPLPVLSRGEKDEGVKAQPGLIPPYPTLLGWQLPRKQPSVLMGQTVALNGFHLDKLSGLSFSSPNLEEPILLDVDHAWRSGNDVINVRLPADADAASWPVGSIAVSGVWKRNPANATESSLNSNEINLVVAPEIDGDLQLVDGDVDGQINRDDTVVLTSKRKIYPKQKVSLLLNEYAFDRILDTDSDGATKSLKFALAKKIPAGLYRVRLRVDGVDSHIIDYAATPQPLEFTGQQVTVHE